MPRLQHGFVTEPLVEASAVRMLFKVAQIHQVHSAYYHVHACTSLALHSGSQQRPRCTLAYAPPDVVAAVHSNHRIEVSPALDMWAVGVMAYEAVVGHRALTALSAIKQCAAGTRPFPWELRAEEQESAWRKSRLRGLLARCLSRDPVQRPSAAALAASLSDVGQVTMHD